MESKAVTTTGNAAAGGKDDPQYATQMSEYLRRYAPDYGEVVPDMIEKRYRVNVGQPLPEYDSATATAYAAEDINEPEKRFFALVCKKGTVQRHGAIEALKKVRHPNLLVLVTTGTVTLSSTREEYFAIVYERPAGERLSVLLAAQARPLNENFIREHIIGPLTNALQQLGEAGVVHGRLNADNIYFGNAPVLGDCVSEPCGLSQIFYYEPLERLQCDPHAKGEGNGSQDFYALGVLTLYILFGPQHFAPFTPENLPRFFFRDGEMVTLTRNRDYPEGFYEFFRGLLAHSSDERWNLRFLRPWLEGKRFNIIAGAGGPPATDNHRPFDAGTMVVRSRKELGHVLHTNMAALSESLENGKLAQWTSLYLRNKEIAESLSRVTRAMSGPKNNDSATYELLMRAILQIDPHGPIRFKQLSMNVDGIGPLIAHLFATNAQSELQLLSKFISFSMADIWLEAQRNIDDQRVRARDFVPTASVNAVMPQLDRARQFVRNAGFGFGLERVLYDLNPQLPCQSPLVSRWHITTIPALLKKLDELAPNLANSDEPIDRHIAGFIFSKTSSMQELRLHALENFPNLANNRALLALSLMNKAQERSSNLKLPGLSHWLALRILPALDMLRSRSLRNRIKAALNHEANTGRLQQMAEMLAHTNYPAPDGAAFNRALKTYQLNKQRIAYYKNPKTAEYTSAIMGARIGKFFAYLMLIISILSVIGDMNG